MPEPTCSSTSHPGPTDTVKQQVICVLQAYVIGVNRTGEDPNATYPGRSIIVDPHGVILADATEREGVVSADCDPRVVADWRNEFPALRDGGFGWGATRPRVVPRTQPRPSKATVPVTLPAGPTGTRDVPIKKYFCNGTSAFQQATLGWHPSPTPNGGESGVSHTGSWSQPPQKKIITPIDKPLSGTTLYVPRAQLAQRTAHP